MKSDAKVIVGVIAATVAILTGAKQDDNDFI